MASTDLEKQILASLETAAPDHDIDIVDVEVVGSSKAPCVRIRIDHADESLPTITLDEVSAQSAWIGEILDSLDPIASSYVLEVSSPGLARPLRREKDFVRFAGSKISLNTNAREGRRKYSGVLEGVRDGKVVVTCDEGEFSFALDEIRSAKLQPQFD